MQVRYGLNYLETGKGEAIGPEANGMWSPYTKEPVLDYRDDETVWVWLNDDLCVEVERELVTRILQGFLDQDADGRKRD